MPTRKEALRLPPALQFLLKGNNFQFFCKAETILASPTRKTMWLSPVFPRPSTSRARHQRAAPLEGRKKFFGHEIEDRPPMASARQRRLTRTRLKGTRPIYGWLGACHRFRRRRCG